ncbi:hypothetical protein GRI58_06895 [Porphyrobacter algicida]|uniref:DUF2336 domain-containing protein n=1 Tax=Qipengyuania algicida TaxID=1836209 RepID=A0A845AJ19_9SPHN|nr:hypothetical protein [Qipengyuania algicida]MXP28546.1 hypothetical protein [Qipengyuania algicida]
MSRAELPVADALRGSLARGDDRLMASRPILAMLVGQRDHSLFAEHIVARVRAMLVSIATQLLRAQADAIGESGKDEFVANRRSELVQRLAGQRHLLDQLHALAIEWHLATDLEARLTLDPVLSPLLQDLVGNGDPEIASVAMAALSAQARFAQSQRRMEIALAELPADLFHEALIAWRELSNAPLSDVLERAEKRLRDDFDEGSSRISLFSRLVMALGDMASSALQVEFAGVGLFLSALAIRSGQTREMVTSSTNPQLIARLILGLRAAGLKPTEVEAQVLRILPEAELVPDLDSIGIREAARWLAAANDAGTR